jgi:hypothetical protein
MLLSDKLKPKEFRKEYLPGYTGHVPKRDHLFGMTAGEINRQIITGNDFTVS